MTGETVVVTGGNGTLGTPILAELAAYDYHTINLSRGKRRETVADVYLRTDLLDPGDVYGALAHCEADAVVHMGVTSTNGAIGHRSYESNVMSSYYVLEAAAALDVETVCLGSSPSIVTGWDPSPAKSGGNYPENSVARFEFLPLDEAHPVAPSGPYGLAKHALESTADGFGTMAGAPRMISTLRFSAPQSDDQLRERYGATDRTLSGLRRNGRLERDARALFGYTHIDDAATACRLAVEADFQGHERFFVAAADTTADVPTARLVEECYPNVVTKTEFEGHTSLYSTEKATELLGWRPTRSWRAD